MIVIVLTHCPAVPTEKFVVAQVHPPFPPVFISALMIRLFPAVVLVCPEHKPETVGKIPALATSVAVNVTSSKKVHSYGVLELQ